MVIIAWKTLLDHHLYSPSRSGHDIIHRKPPTVVREHIEQAPRDRHDGKPGEKVDPIVAGFIVSLCPFAARDGGMPKSCVQGLRSIKASARMLFESTSTYFAVTE